MQSILVSEDSIIVNQHICKTLEVSGYKVFSAFDGLEAVKVAKEHKPDLILMDIMMETQDDGIRAALEIKEALDIPVIFLTALTDEGTLEKVKNSEPYGYIVKPFNEVELLSNIKVALHKSKAENEVKNNRDLFQVTLNAIDQAFIVFYEDAVFYLNRNAERLIDKNFEEVIGMAASHVLPLFDESGATLSLSDLKRIEQDAELKAITKGHEVAIGEVVVKEVFVKSKKYTMLTFKDISMKVQARQLEADLEKRRYSSLLEGQENERNRLSREIHDGVGQMVNLLKLNVKALPESDQKSILESNIENTLKEIRSVSENLHPSRLNDFSLEANLKALISNYNENSNKTYFHFEAIDIPEVSQAAKVHIYRIVQEAVNNIIKHAEASESNIQLLRMEKELQLTIEDDGIGYDIHEINKENGHHGINNITYRVNCINGRLIMDSKPQKGTMILITIPID